VSNSIAISVIIPCYNAEETIGDQLEALIAQECSELWEIIVADNGSTDNTRKIVEAYSTKLPSLSIVDASAKAGVSYARNTAVKYARGEFIAFCDADDEVAPGWLQSILNSVKEYGFVASRMDAFKLSDSRAAKLKKSRQTVGLIEYSYVPYLTHAGASGLAVRKDLHDIVGGFDEEFHVCEDCDYCWKIQLQGTPLKFETDALIHIRHRGTAFERFQQAVKWGTYNVLLVKKYVPLGMPRPKLSDMYRQWKSVINLLPKIRSHTPRDRLIWSLGYRLGQIKGSIKFKYLAL
jgi:glycosyltransferase involved in cell wall biosynthesis